MYYCFVINSPTDGCLDCLQILATVNNAAMNTGVLMFFLISVLGSKIEQRDGYKEQTDSDQRGGERG